MVHKLSLYLEKQGGKMKKYIVLGIVTASFFSLTAIFGQDLPKIELVSGQPDQNINGIMVSCKNGHLRGVYQTQNENGVTCQCVPMGKIYLEVDDEFFQRSSGEYYKIQLFNHDRLTYDSVSEGSMTHGTKIYPSRSSCLSDCELELNK